MLRVNHDSTQGDENGQVAQNEHDIESLSCLGQRGEALEHTDGAVGQVEFEDDSVEGLVERHGVEHQVPCGEEDNVAVLGGEGLELGFRLGFVDDEKQLAVNARDENHRPVKQQVEHKRSEQTERAMYLVDGPKEEDIVEGEGGKSDGPEIPKRSEPCFDLVVMLVRFVVFGVEHNFVLLNRALHV